MGKIKEIEANPKDYLRKFAQQMTVTGHSSLILKSHFL